MLATLRNALKVKDLRQRLFFTFMMLLVIRLGSQLPCPGVDRTYFSSWFAKQSAEAFNFFNAFTGGSFEQMSILALSITPYITSSIIIQLLTIAIPQLEEMQRDGEDGRKKLTAITRYVTVGLALIEGTAMAIGFGNQGLIPAMSSSSATFFTKAGSVITVVAALTAGSTFLMWIGERITEKGVGNGTSIVLMINILSRIPSDMNSLFEMFVFKDGQTVAKGALAAVIIIAVILVTIVLVIVLNDATRKIPVQYAKRIVGNKQYGGARQYIPLKVNAAGVMPIIFAQAIMFIPITFIGFSNVNDAGGFLHAFTDHTSFWYNFVFAVMIILFTYFYTAITINPTQMAEDMKRNNGFIPGIKPGKKTAEYIDDIMSRITLPGSFFLALVAIMPDFAGIFGVQAGFAQFFGGTSLLILVGVVLDTLQQVESHLLMRHYDGLLKSGRIKGRAGVAAY